MQNTLLGEKTAMNPQATTGKRLPRLANSLIESVGYFLTPAVWKQAHRHDYQGRKRRWELHPLVLVVLVMTWCCGDSLAERFETAKAFCVVCRAKRRRPGKSFGGFQKALSKLPVRALRSLALAVRGRIQAWFASRWKFGGWVPFSVDGSRLQCPLT